MLNESCCLIAATSSFPLKNGDCWLFKFRLTIRVGSGNWFHLCQNISTLDI
ncbi:hypothetical protein Glove_349g99 [Diversispora epigaea]|uniref:Uncharacterized protein n=1 Tax=Diversispora epigaea TaxID=1348612 RepID=A0A397HJ23_9GLOM|nr:hypothetical protein Glove_349g99 [Diversispora epigaea]